MDDSNRFLKDEERISLKNKATPTKRRTTPLVILLLDLTLIVMVYVFIARPALEKLEKEQDKIIVDEIEITYDFFKGTENYFFDMYIKNNSIKEKIIKNNLFYIKTSYSEDKIFSNLDNFIIEPNNSKHLLFELNIPENIDKFFIKIFYKNKEIYQTELFNVDK